MDRLSAFIRSEYNAESALRCDRNDGPLRPWDGQCLQSVDDFEAEEADMEERETVGEMVLESAPLQGWGEYHTLITLANGHLYMLSSKRLEEPRNAPGV